MIGFKQTATIACCLWGLYYWVTKASLVDNGNGLLYDTVLNITWLQDANYAKTSNYSTTGFMTWYDSKLGPPLLIIRVLLVGDWRAIHQLMVMFLTMPLQLMVALIWVITSLNPFQNYLICTT